MTNRLLLVALSFENPKAIDSQDSNPDCLSFCEITPDESSAVHTDQFSVHSDEFSDPDDTSHLVHDESGEECDNYDDFPEYVEGNLLLKKLRIQSIQRDVVLKRKQSIIDERDILYESDDSKHAHGNRIMRDALRRYQFCTLDELCKNTFCPLCSKSFSKCVCKYDFEIQSTLSDVSDFFLGSSIPREYVKNLLIDVTLLIVQIVNSRNKIGICASIATFCRARSDDFSNISQFITLLSDMFFEEFPSLESQSNVENFFSSAHDIMNTFDDIQKLPIFQKLRKIILFALSFSIFSKMGFDFDSVGYSRMQSDSIRRKHKSSTGFVRSILDLVLYICEQGYMIYKYNDFSGVLHSSKSYGKFFDKVMKLKGQFPFLSNPEPSGFTESEFLGELSSTREEGQNLLKLFKVRKDIFDDNDLKKLKILLSDLDTMWNQYHTKTAAAKTRKPPLAVLLYGESGVGKSSVKDMLAEHFCNVTGLPSGDEYRYVRNPASDFWDGFSTQQHTIILDDIAYLRPSACSDIDPTLKDLIQLINPTPFVPNQASLEDKGKTPCRPRLVIGTTNVIDLNANMYVSHATAIQRRMPYIIIPTVKKEYSKAGGALDTSKAPLFDGYPDLWTFEVREVKSRHISRSHEGADIVTLPGCEKMDLKSFLQWYNGIIFEHEENQNRMQQSTINMKETKICNVCKIPDYMCTCVEEQSALSDFGSMLTGISLLIFLLRTLLKDYLFYSIIKSITGFFDLSSLKSKVISLCTFKKKSPREAFCAIGSKAQNYLSRPSFLVGLASAICVGIGFVKFSSWTFNFQGAKQSKPVPHAFERENPWIAKSKDLTSAQGCKKARCVGKQDLEHILRLFSKNIYKMFCEVGDDDQGYFGYLTGMVGNKYIAVNHTIPVGGFHMKVTKEDFLTAGVNSTRRFWVEESQVTRFPDRDLCILQIACLPPVRDITPYLAPEKFSVSAPGVLLSHPGGTMISVDKMERDSSVHKSLLPNLNEVWMNRVEIPTVVGDCGKLYVHLGPQGPQIVGIHIAGKPGDTLALATPVYDSLDFSNHGPVQGFPEISALSAERTLFELYPRLQFPLFLKELLRYLDHSKIPVQI